jgi:arylsulfatase A-like enzyme
VRLPCLGASIHLVPKRVSILRTAAVLAALAACLAAGSATTGGSSAAHAAGRPNIVLILVDDQPVLDGRLLDYEPAVRDQIAARGATFTDFHSESPLCCPARAGYMTGQHTHNHGVFDNAAVLFDPTMTIATQLQRAGYYTMLAGKYLNGYKASRTKKPWLAPNVPPGWNRWSAMGKPAYYRYTLYQDGGTQEVHGTAPADYSTDVIAAKAVSMIRSAPAGQPLFAWIAPFSAHTPFTPAPRYAGATCGTADRFWKPPSWNEADVSDKPEWVQDTPLLRGRKGFDLNSLCRAMLGVNDLVQEVVSALEATGRLQNTILIYAGDNGMMSGEHRMKGKTAPYETQVPFYLRWDGVVGPGSRISERLQNIDLAPTLCAVAGCRLGPYPNGQTGPDGTSFAPLLYGWWTRLSRQTVLDELPFGHEQPSNDVNTPSWEAITSTGASPLARQGCAVAASGGCRWHLIVDTETGERELYDVSNGPCWAWSPGLPGDPCELRNLAGNPAYRGELDQLLTAESAMATERGAGP